MEVSLNLFRHFLYLCAGNLKDTELGEAYDPKTYRLILIPAERNRAGLKPGVEFLADPKRKGKCFELLLRKKLANCDQVHQLDQI